MKKWFILVVLIGLFVTCLVFNNEIVTFFVNRLTSFGQNASVLTNNDYAKEENYNFVQLTNDFSPNNQQDIINIYYTILNSGMTDFIFYCPTQYENCVSDVDYVSNNQKLLSDINNFVPVYNSFSNIETEFDSLGKVSIHITHNYQPEEITTLQTTIKDIIQENISQEMTQENQIKVIHDYIINNTKYDIERSDHKVTTYHSDTAYGALIEHYAICGGYADSMKLFLDYLQIPNYKISSENHIWNLVYLNNAWYHLDLTWDDPVTSNGEDVLEYDYFLITSEELKELETDQHIFDETIYQEAKSN